MAEPSYEALRRFEQDMADGRERTRQLLREIGRQDVLEAYDKSMRDIDLGITGARSSWHSLSWPQRTVVQYLVEHGGALEPNTNHHFRTTSARYTPLLHIGRPTVRALIARGFLDCEGDQSFDPEARVVLSDRGRFVFRHGRE